MTNLALFQFNDNEIRFIDGQPVANDVAAALGYADPVNTIRKKVKDKNKGVAKMATPGGTQSVVVLKEAGIYQLIFGSKLDSAEQFQDWVFEEVLPAIRKTGSYSIFTDHRLDPEWQAERQDGKDVRRSLTDATKAWIERNCPNMKPWEQRRLYASHSDALNVALFGRTAKELIEYFDCNKNKLRDQFTKPEIAALKSLEWMAIRLVDIDNLPPVKAIHEAVKLCLAKGMFVDHHTEPRPLAPAKVKTKRISKKQSLKLPSDDFIQLTWFE